MFLKIIILLTFLVSPMIGFTQDDRQKITGKFDFSSNSAEILGEETAAHYEKVLEPDEKIKWTVHVPENYDPVYPPGIIVHLTTRNRAILPFGWNSVLKNKNLIWISLNKSGRPTQNKEVLLTVMATVFIESKYKVNTDRIYISALTETCFPASATMQIYPSIFKGVIYTSCFPINWKDSVPDTIEQMKKNRYVFIASSHNMLEKEIRRMVRKYKTAGIEKIEYLNLSQLQYGKNLDRPRLTQSIEFLDTRD